MNVRWFRFTGAVAWVVAGLVPGQRAKAQERPASPSARQGRQQADAIPRDLVMGLFVGFSDRLIRVDTAGDGIPAGLLRDARVLGSMGNEMSSTTAAYFPCTAREALDSVDARLAALGWRKATQRLMAQMRGFVPSRSAAIEMPEYVCIQPM